MLKVVSTNIVSPLGMSSQENWRSVMQGRSALRRLESYKGIPLPFVASVFTPEQVEELAIEGFTRFESLAIRSITEALTHTDLDVRGERTTFILSTTKADVEELGFAEERDGDYHRPALSAQRIAEHVGIGGGAIVCCNACISGVSAQILADRLISAGHYDNAVVCGADLVSSFTASGFLSFKSLSNEACRPFDADRQGLNLGEAAATIVFTRADSLREGDSETAIIPKITSSTPEAPSVCPNQPLSAVRGTAESPAFSIATDSIWSLNIVAVPCALTNASSEASLPFITASRTFLAPSPDGAGVLR